MFYKRLCDRLRVKIIKSLEFEWDDQKDALNRLKHKVSFETAKFVFDDENLLIYPDDTHGREELRYIALGVVHELLYVVFAERKERIRIISARLADKRERRLYYDRIFYPL